MMDSQAKAKEQLLEELMQFFQQKAGQSVKGEFPGSAEEESMESPAEEKAEMPAEESAMAPEMSEEMPAEEGEEAPMEEEVPSESTRGFDIEKMKAMIAAKKRR